MSKRSINKAVRRYEAATSPAAIKRILARFKSRGLAGHVTAASLRADAAAELRDVIAAEVVY